MSMDWDSPELEALITTALAEDIGSGDVAVSATIPPNITVTAKVVALQDLVCAGLRLVEKIFGRLDPDISVELHVSDGHRIADKALLATVNGNAGAILTGGQTVVNLLSHLCGIATLTSEYVSRIAGMRTMIRDTRVTSPGLRGLEQYAIRAGGGVHHRRGLFDAVVLTNDHIGVAGGIKAALDQAHSHASRLMNPLELTAYEATGTIPTDTSASSLPIQVEIRNETELREALSVGAESIQLSEITPRQVGELVSIAREIRRDCVVEVSGDISLGDVRVYAEAGVDYLSPQALSSDAPRASLRLLVDSPREK